MSRAGTTSTATGSKRCDQLPSISAFAMGCCRMLTRGLAVPQVVVIGLGMDEASVAAKLDAIKSSTSVGISASIPDPPPATPDDNDNWRLRAADGRVVWWRADAEMGQESEGCVWFLDDAWPEWADPDADDDADGDADA
eukprot:1040058-Rhodomonas_salina.2